MSENRHGIYIVELMSGVKVVVHKEMMNIRKWFLKLDFFFYLLYDKGIVRLLLHAFMNNLKQCTYIFIRGQTHYLLRKFGYKVYTAHSGNKSFFFCDKIIYPEIG